MQLSQNDKTINAHWWHVLEDPAAERAPQRSAKSLLLLPCQPAVDGARSWETLGTGFKGARRT